MINEEQIARSIKEEYEQLSNDRSNFDSHCQEIAERFIPAHRNQFTSRGQSATKGEKRHQDVFDSTAGIALGRFASILDSLLTPRNQTWHRTISSNPDLNKDRAVKLYFEELNRTLFKYRYAPKANFASQNQQNYLSLGAYGNGCLYTDDLKEVGGGTRYRNIHLGEIFFMENHQGIVDGAIRYFSMKARQAIQKWGDKCPEVISKEKNKQREFFFLHCVKPRTDIDPRRKDYKGMPFASYYMAMEAPEKLLEEGGYETFPYAISRYIQHSPEVYGRSPAMEVLATVKTLNEQAKTLLKQGQRIADPILLMHDDGLLNAFSMKPGAANSGAVTADGRPLVHTLPMGNVNIGKDMMDDNRAQINDVFLITIFQIMTENPQMTATEVLERSKEKGILLAPTIGRQQSEYLGPMIEREIDILSRQGKLPQMPPVLREAKGEYSLIYDSPLTRAQRAEEASGFARSVETAITVVNVTQNPEPLDHFDWDVIIPEMSDIHGVPTRWMRDPKLVEQIRKNRAEAAQAQEAAMAAPGAAAVMSSAAKVADAGGGSARARR